MLEGILILLIRLSVGFNYLYAAYMNTRNSMSREWTVNHTAILFQNTGIDSSHWITKTSAIIGMFMMYVGSISLLFGIEPRLGALMLLVFTLLGTIIHHREKQIALNSSKSIVNLVPEQGKATFNEITWSAFGAHFSCVLKNIGFVGLLIWLVLSKNVYYTFILTDSLKIFIYN